MVKLSDGETRIYGEAAFEVLAKAQELERQGKKILHFEIGEPDMETPENVAKQIVNGIIKKKPILVLTIMGKIGYLVSRFFPLLYEHLMTHKFKKEL